MSIRCQFVLGASLSSRTIAWYSAGHFSHTDILLPNGYLLGARSDKIGGAPAGVQIRPPNYETWKSRVVMSLSVTPEQERKFYDFAMQQIGRPYDSTAIWGFAVGRDWRSANSWFCSELATAALEISGACPNLYAPRNKVTPAALATVLSALGATFKSYASKEDL